MGNFWLDKIELDETRLEIEEFIFSSLRGRLFSDTSSVGDAIRALYVKFFQYFINKAHIFNRYNITFSVAYNQKQSSDVYCTNVVASIN